MSRTHRYPACSFRLSARPLLPSTTVSLLFPFLNQSRHIQHSLSSHLQSSLQCPLPQLALDLLSLARSLDHQALLYPPPLLLTGLLDSPWQKIDYTVLARELDQVGLFAQAIDGRVPASGCEVFGGEKRVGVGQVVCFRRDG